MPSSPTRRHLRQGYSTGACVTAVIMAAWESLCSGLCRHAAERVILFPDGKHRVLIMKDQNPGFAATIKDGGDDPDCTHLAKIYARVRRGTPDEAGEHDYVLHAGEGMLIHRAVEGIGLCTRPGLDCEQNRWAINIGPRRMIADNLAEASAFSACFIAEIGVKNGEQLATKTLNAQLGILGGISILGTTGIVRPFSHEAYIETIRICMRSARLSGFDEVILCTGGRTQSRAKRHLPGIPDASFVCMGDFIADSLHAAREQGLRRLTIACMPGKLCKYAAGFDNTHAHRVRQDIDLFLDTLEQFHSPTAEDKQAIAACASVRQALEHIPADCRLPLYRRLCTLAFRQFARRAPLLEFRLLICDFDGSLLLDTTSQDSLPCLP